MRMKKGNLPCPPWNTEVYTPQGPKFIPAWNAAQVFVEGGGGGGEGGELTGVFWDESQREERGWGNRCFGGRGERWGVEQVFLAHKSSEK